MFLALICRRFLGSFTQYTHCCRALTLALARFSCLTETQSISGDGTAPKYSKISNSLIGFWSRQVVINYSIRSEIWNIRTPLTTTDSRSWWCEEGGYCCPSLVGWRSPSVDDPVRLAADKHKHIFPFKNTLNAEISRFCTKRKVIFAFVTLAIQNVTNRPNALIAPGCELTEKERFRGLSPPSRGLSARGLSPCYFVSP